MSDRAEPTIQEFWADADPERGFERFGRLVNAVDDGIYQLDADGRFVAVNDAIVETTGHAREDLLGEHVSVLLAESDVVRLEREIRDRLRTGSDDATAFDMVVRTVDGERVPCELRFSLLTTDGSLDGTVGIVRAVDEPSEVHDQLTSVWDAHDSISSVIDEADVGVFVLDDAFEVVWIDESIEEYFGVDRTELVGRNKRTVIEETIRDRLADPDGFVETVGATYDDNTYVERFEFRITPGDDREGRWMEHRSKPIESGRYAGGRIELYYDVTERKESEQARHESERQFQSLVDAVEEYAIFMLDSEGTVVSWNSGAEQIKGYETDEIVGKHFSTFYTDEAVAAGIPERNLSKAATEGSVEDEGWRVRADGSRFWANVTITALYEEGELQGYAKVTRDMTERREREQQLQRERDVIERILETSPVGIAVVNPDGSTSRANERMADLLDVPPADVSEYTAGQREMFDEHRDRLAIEDRPAARAFETGEPVYDQEIFLDSPDGQGTWLSINATPITDERGTPEQVVVTATDITDLRELAARRKRELQEREKELASVQLATDLLEPGGQPIDELLQEFVAALPQSFRYPDLTAARVSIGDHEAATDGYEPLEPSITAHTRTEKDTPITIEVVRLDQPQDDAEAFIDEGQELIDTLAALVKFHFDRREYIEELRAETRRLEQFAYAASHDLQEPLRMISTYLQLLEQQYGDALDEDGEQFLEFAVDGAERMREMIDGLLKYAQVKTRGEPLEPVDLDAVVEDVLSDLQVRIAESDAEITVESLPHVEGDPSQLRQLFLNLVDNAIEYSTDTPNVHIGADRRGAMWVVSVRDEGIGIEPDQQDRIFDVFERLHSREEHAGSGIGLALCERIVERHEGEIWVDSTPGEGTTFSFTLLPASPNEA